MRLDLRTASLLLALAAPLAVRADASSAAVLMDDGYRRKASGDLPGAATAFEDARRAGFDPQRADLELGYLALASGSTGEARRKFESASLGADRELATQARSELGALRSVPSVRRDLYAEAFAWTRAAGSALASNAVPMLRVRALHAPFDDVPLDVYLFAQATRDLASRGHPIAPRIYADDRALVGAGLQLRLFGGRAALFAQLAPAFALIEDGRDPVLLDARLGAAGSTETRGCSPAPAHGARLRLLPCADLYAEAVYLSRFDHDLVAGVRGRAGATWLVTGPVAWTALVETRAAVDRLAHPYANFAEAGLGHRWRLLRPLRLDVMALAAGGAVLRGNVAEPVPSPRSYLDLRLVAATFTEF